MASMSSAEGANRRAPSAARPPSRRRSPRSVTEPRSRRRTAVDNPAPEQPQPALPGQAAAVWVTVVAALEQSGFAVAGPEYVKLSRLLLEQRALEFAEGKDADEQWLALRDAARAALTLLDPLHRAATRLTQLPIEPGTPDAPPHSRTTEEE